MMILYLIVITIFALYTYNVYKHYKLIQAVNTVTGNPLTIPVLVNGKTTKAFTIEKSFLVLASKTVTVGYLTYILIKIGNFFGFSAGNTFMLHTKYAKALCYKELQTNALNASYIVNIHESVRNINNREINVFLYGNAIVRYSDTLPIFSIDTTASKIKKFSKLTVLKSIIVAMVLFIGANISIYIASLMLTNYLVNNFSLQNEEILWSYLDNKVKNDLVHRIDLLNAQNELQKLIDTIPVSTKGSKYNFLIHITNSQDMNIILYPAGHIVVSLGLIKKLISQNQAVFILSHMIKHYNDRDHIKAISNKLVNLSIIINLFGRNSLIGILIVWKSDFHVNFSVNEEIEADYWALTAIENLYNSSLGSDIFENIFTKSQSKNLDIFHNHPITTERSNSLRSHITQIGSESKNEIPLEYEVEDISHNDTTVLAEAPNYNENFVILFGHYKTSMNKQYTAYQEFLKPLSGLLNFHSQLTLAELDYKRNLLDKGIKEIKDHKYIFQNIVDEYNVKFTNYISLQKGIEQKISLERTWLEEKINTLNIMNFYIDRDLEILQNQLIIVQFLSSRFGSYKVNRNSIEFQTAKEESDYHMLKNRVDEISRRIPPANITVTN